MSLMSTLVASLLFVGLLIAPAWWGQQVESGELDAFSLGLSSTPFSGMETAADAHPIGVLEAPVAVTVPGAATWLCKEGAVFVTQSQDVTVQTNISNPNTLGDGYASFVTDTAGYVGDTNRGTFGSDAWCNLKLRTNVTKADMIATDVIGVYVETTANFTWDFIGLTVIQVTDATGVVVDSVPLNDRLVSDLVDSVAETWPMTTQNKLLVSGTFPDTLPAGQSLQLVVDLFEDVTDGDFPQEGDIVIYDVSLEGERDGLLNNQNKLITFNIGYVLIGGLLVVIATPWVSWDSLFGGVSKLGRNRRGSMMSLGGIVVLGVGVLAAALIFSGGSFTGLFTASLLPLSLAIMGVALVALSTKGKSNPGFAFVMAALAALMGWFLGVAVQDSWLAYDKLYVAPFVEVITGNVGLTSVFELSAFFVVAVQIAGILVALYNIVSTFTSDDRVSIVQ